MSGSGKFLGLLESVHTLLTNYPVHAALASVKVEIDSYGQEVAAVHLWPTRLTTLAAGLIEWERTLATPTASVWRTLDGHSVHLTIQGRSDEGDVPMRVWGATPFHEHLFGDLAPGERRLVDTSVLSGLALGTGRVIP